MSSPIELASPRESATLDTLVCHCQRVTYARVAEAIESDRATSLADLQRETSACTRCFGCRFELERMLKEHLGEAYVRTTSVAPPQPKPTLAQRLARAFRAKADPLPARMYMPAFVGFRGRDVETRVVSFHWRDELDGPSQPVGVRADVLALDGTRLAVWRTAVGPRRSAVLDVRSVLNGGEPPDGVCVVKLVIEAAQVESLRPYFHLISRGGITSTHEKKAPKRTERAAAPRRYHWIFPVARSPFPEEAWLVCTNTHGRTIDDTRLIWRSDAGDEAAVDFPVTELDQTACIPLHEHFPAIGQGSAGGSIRIEPSPHLAGFIVRYDAERDLWRVQHL